MKLSHYSQIDSKRFDSEIAKGVTGRVAIGKNDGAANFCMRVFEIDEDGFTPRHTHDWEHEIFFHDGQGEALCEGEWKPVSAGSVLYIPGNIEHQIKNTGQGPLVFACLIPSGAPEL